jgi:rubrerythrin
MPTEQERVIQALQYAIRMENDGKAFYLKSCGESSNELGRKLMESLAKQEDYHRIKFEEIYETIRKSRSWPKVDFKIDGGRTLRTIFARETEGGQACVPGDETEIAIVQRAMKMEAESFDFYHARSEQSHGAEHEFFEDIAAEEREHQLVLTDYWEYLKNPAGWFVKTEKPGLDGGA